MTMMMGRWGRMVPVQSGSSPFPHDRSDGGGVAVSASGRRYATPQQPVTRRQWSWLLEGLDDADQAVVEQLVHDQRRGRLWWLDPVAAASNMIHPEVAEPMPPDLGTTDASTATVDGRVWDLVAGEVSTDVPTVVGVGYTVQLRAGSTSDVSVESLDHDRETTGTVGTDTGTELLEVTWTAGVEPGVRVTADGTGWSGLQMFETSKDPGGWRPGRGCPQVLLRGLSQRLLRQLIEGEVLWSDVSATLVEVDG